MLTMLRKRHARQGNGGSGEYAFLTHVRDEAGFSGSRTMDALAMSLWPSRGLALHGFEVKCSRSDWVKELRTPEKAEKLASRCDYWWLVVADPAIVKPGELPEGWGLLVATPPKIDEETGRKVLGTLRVVKAAPKQALNEDKRLITRSWLVALLRAAGAVPDDGPPVEPEAIMQARADGIAIGTRQAENQIEAANTARENARHTLQDERDIRLAFEGATGIHLVGWKAGPGAGLARAQEVGNVVRAALAGDAAVTAAQTRLTYLENDLRGIADRLKEAREGA